MKWFLSKNCSQIAIFILFSLQITATVCNIDQTNNTIKISNQIHIPDNIFENGSENITTIQMTWNSIKTLSKNIFKKCNKLETLDLSYNDLITLPEYIFENKTNLTTLFLHSNEFTTFPENVFKDLFNLKVLDLSYNHLSILSETIFKSQVNLVTLDLHANKLTTIPEHLFQNKINLTTLSLWGNELTTLSENTFESLINLQSLDIGSNKLTELPERIFQNQKELRSLQLHKNNLETLSRGTIEDILKNSNLTQLRLNGNPWQCDCEFLRETRPNATKFQLGDIECADHERMSEKFKRPIVSMISLPESDQLNQKYVKRICESYPSNETTICPFGCNCLFNSDNSSVFFDCSNGNLKNISDVLGKEFRLMSEIKEIELNLNNDNITTLPYSTMHGFELITKITASNNSIKFINVDNLPQNLTELDVSKNKLKFFTRPVIHQLSNMKMLKRLVLEGNPWICDNSFFVFIQSKREIVDYEQIICGDGELLVQKYNRLFG